MEAIAEALNFTLKLNISAPRNLGKNNFDLLDILNSNLAPGKFIYGTVLYTDGATFAVPLGEPYSDLEKMFMMFDWEVWVAIGSTLLMALVVIQIIKFMSKKVQNFVFGRNIKTPTMNMIEIFLCGAQVRVPGRNFARFLLMLFIIWCLIIRTCYQSKLFEFLQADLRRPGIKTLEELYESNLTSLTFTTEVPQEYKSSTRKAILCFTKKFI